MLTEYTYPGGQILLEDDNPTTPKKVTLEYEARKVQWLQANLKPGMCFVDVGAHHGYYTLLAAKLVGNQGQVLAYEANPDNFYILHENLINNDYYWAIANSQALSNEEKQMSLAIMKRTDRCTFHQSNEKMYSIQATTFDRFYKAYQSPIDVIKIDTQGHEYQVVQGMEQTLKANPDCKVLLEVHPHINPESSQAVDLLHEWRIEII